MVFAHVAAFFVDKFLGNYIENIDSHQLKINLWHGDITLENVHLKTNSLNNFNLPFEIETGYLDKLQIHIPWKHLYTHPTKIIINGFYLLLSPKTDVQYDREQSEQQEYQMKMKEVKKVEDFRREKEEYEKTQQTQHHKDTFFERLQFHILRNLEIQINHIHIAYDDKTTKKCSPFQFGLTLESLKLLTTNDQWEDIESKEDSKLIYKLGEINQLSIYWNSNMKSSRLDLSKEDIVNDLKSNNHLKYSSMNYILQPLNIQSKLSITKTAQEQDFKQTVLNGQIICEQIYFNINRNQYSDLLDFLEYHDNLQLKYKYLKYSQMINSIEYPRLSLRRWKYAYTAIIHEIVRPRLLSFQWENMRNNLHRYKEYYQIYFKELNHQQDLKHQQELEKQIDVFNLIYIRRTAQIEYQKTKVEEKDSSWWEKLTHWWKSHPDHHDDNDDDQAEEVQSNEEKHQLYQAIGYDDDANQSKKKILYPEEYIDMDISLRIDLIQINVWSFLNENDSNLKIISSLAIPQSQLTYQRRPARDDFLFLVDIQSFQMFGIQSDSEDEHHHHHHHHHKSSRPILIQPLNKTQTNLLHLEFETNPIQTKSDYRLHGSSQPLQINYHAMTINKLFECFLPDRHHDLEGLKEAAYSIYRDIKQRTQFLLSENLKKIQDLDINIQLESVYFLLPEYGSLKQSSSLIGLDLGSLTFKGGNRNILNLEQDIYYDAQSSVVVDNNSSVVPIEIRLNRIQAFYLNQEESFQEFISKDQSSSSSSSSHIIEPITITLDVLKSINIKNTNLPIWSVNGEIFSIECRISDTRLYDICHLIQTIPYPKSFDQDSNEEQEKAIVDKKEPKPSTKEQYETIEKSTPVQKILHEEEQELDKQEEIKQSPTQEQIKQIQFNFLISKIDLHLLRALLDSTNYTEEFVYISLEMIQGSLSIKTYDIEFNGSLQDFSIIHQQFLTNDNLKLKFFSRQNQSKLLSFNCLLTSNSNPQFSSAPYHSIENHISIQLNKCLLNIHLQALASIISYKKNIEQKLSNPSKPKSIKSKSSSSSDQSSSSASSSFKIDFCLEEIGVLIGSEYSHIIYIQLKDLKGYLSKSNLKMLCHLILNDFRVIDLFLQSPYQYIISKENQSNELIKLDFCLFNYQTKPLNKSNDQNSFIKGEIQKLNLIFLYKHLQLISSLINSFQTQPKQEAEEEVSSSDQSNSIFSMIDKYQEYSIELEFNFLFNLPRIILPLNSSSKKGLAFDFGQLRMYTDSKITSSSSIEQHRITLDKLSFNPFVIDDNQNEIVNQTTINLFECSPLLILINRQLNSNENPLSIKIQWDTIHFKFDKDNYILIQQILNENFQEKNFYQIPQLINQREENSSKPIQSSKSIQSFKSNSNQQKIEINFQIKQIHFNIYHSNIHDENNQLIYLTIELIEINLQFISNSISNGSIQIEHLYLDDLQKKMISRLIDKHWNVSKDKPLFHLQLHINQSNRKVEGQMESFLICLSPQFFNSIQDFLYYDLSSKEKTKSKRFIPNPTLAHDLQLNLPSPAKSISEYRYFKSTDQSAKEQTINQSSSSSSKRSISSNIQTICDFNLNPSQIILLEDQNNGKCDCLALNISLTMHMINMNNESNISLSMKDFTFNGTNFEDLKQSKIRYSVLLPTEIDCTIILIGDNEQKLDFNLGDISINIDPMILKTFVNLNNSLHKQQQKTIEKEKDEINCPTIFVPQPFKDSSFWFIPDSKEKDDLLEQTDLLFITTGSTSEKTNELKQKEEKNKQDKYSQLSQKLIVNLNTIEVKLELGQGSSTRPVVAICFSEIFAQIENWSTNILIDSSIQIEFALFNDHILAWEPLIEPIIDQYGNVQSPFIILCQTIQNQQEENDSKCRYLLNDDGKENESCSKEKSDDSGLKMGIEKVISIRAEHLLNVTLTKTTLDLSQRIETMFNNAYKKGSSSDIDEEQAMLSIHNQTGFDIFISNIIGIEFPKEKQMKEKNIHLKINESIQLTIPADRLSATHLPAIAEQIAKRKQQFQVQIGENEVLVDINQTWRRVYDLSPSSISSWPIQLLCDSQISQERRKVILSSIIKISNRTQMPLIILDANSIEKNQFNRIAKIDINEEFYLPIELLYLRTIPRLYFAIDQENSSNNEINDFISFDWINESSSDRILKLNDGREGHYVIYKEEIEAYSENTDEPIKKSFNIYIKLALHLLNLLPISIQCSIDNIEKIEIKPSELYHCIQGNKKSILIFQIPSYNNASWISESIDLNSKVGHGIHNEHILIFHQTITDETLRMILRVDTYRQSYRASFYSPFWIINSTDLKFQLKIENEKNLIDINEQTYLICPKKFDSESHKKKGHIRVFSANQNDNDDDDDETLSKWSEAFSLDVIKSQGMTSCQVQQDRTYMISIDIVTSSFGMTKIITLAPATAIINKSSWNIEVNEESSQNEEQYWKLVQSNQIISYWPRFLKEGILCIRYENTQGVSSHFSIDNKHRTLLAMNDDDQQRPAIQVEVISTDYNGYRILLQNYQINDAPLLIVNTLLNQSIAFAQQQDLRTQILPSQYYVYYTWIDQFKPKELIVSIDQRTTTTTTIQMNPVCGIIGEENDERIYYATFIDGAQTVLIFSSDQSVIESISDIPSLNESMKDYIQLSFHSIGISIVDDINREDLIYLTLNQSKDIWTEKRQCHYQPLSSQINLYLEEHYQTHLKQQQQHDDKTKNSFNQYSIDKIRSVSFNGDIGYISNNQGHNVQVKRQSLDSLWIGYIYSSNHMAIHCRLNHLQIDNQLQITMFPTILYPILSKTTGTDQPGKPFIELSIFKNQSTTQSNLIQIKYLKLLIQEFALRIDQGLILALMAFFKPNKNPAAPTIDMTNDLQNLINPLERLINEGNDDQTKSSSSKESQIYFDDLHLSPLKIHVSFSIHGAKADEQLLAEYPLVDFLLQILNIAEVQDVILKLNYYERKNDRYSISKLTKEISNHYEHQFLRQIHVVVLGLDVLGNPFGVIRGVAQGVESFFYEPYKGAMEGPIEFLQGIATGTKYFVGSVVGGAAGALSKVTEATSKGLATLTLDKDYQNARIQRKEIQAETTPELISSGKNTIKDILLGVKGLVKKPMKGGQQSGSKGFVKGLGKGFLGLVGRPASGVADLTSTSFKLIKKIATHEEVIHRIRHPRHIGRDGIVRPSIAHETMGEFIFNHFDQKYLHGDNEGYIGHIKSSTNPSSLLFATTKQFIFLQEEEEDDQSSSSSGFYQILWNIHYKDIKGIPQVKFNPNFIEITIKETNSIGITKKDIQHIRVVPYETIGEARFIVDKMIETSKALEL